MAAPASRANLKNTQLAQMWESLWSQRQLWLGVIVLTSLLVLLNVQVMRDLNDRWTRDPNYGHGVLIPIIALYFIYLRRGRLKGLVPNRSWFGLSLILLGMLLKYIAMPLASVTLAGIGMVVMANGLLLYVGGWQVYRALWFPALYLFLMLPLPEIVHTKIAFPLQLLASQLSAAILQYIFGVSLMLQGNVLLLANQQLSVAEACSGMRSILGLLALGIAFAYLSKRNIWEQVVLVVSTIPIAICVNVIRIVTTGLLHEWGYSNLAEGVYHTLTGWFVFMFALVMFLGVNWLMDRIWVEVPDKDKPAPKPAEGKSSGMARAPRIRLHAHFYAAGVLLLIATVGFSFWLERVNRLKNTGESVPLKQSLSTIPRQLGKWLVVRDIPLTKEVEIIAQVDDYMNRIYKRTDAGEKDEGLQVYVAYWGGIWVAAPHTPEICLRGSGWEIASARRREMTLPGLSGTERVGVNVDVFSKGYDQEMVVWWDYIHGKNVSNPVLERLRWVLPVFLGGKAGSVVQVQISRAIPRGENEEQVYQSLMEFAGQLTPEVGKCLPEAR